MLIGHGRQARRLIPFCNRPWVGLAAAVVGAQAENPAPRLGRKRPPVLPHESKIVSRRYRNCRTGLLPAVRASRPLQPIRKDLVIRFRRQRLAREAIMAAKEISVKKYVVRLSGEEQIGRASCR